MKYAVALSAGTPSLHLSMKMAGIEAYGIYLWLAMALWKESIFCIDMTFVDAVNPVIY